MKRILLLAILTVSTFVITNAQTSHDDLPQVHAKKMVSKVNIAVALKGDEWGKVNNAFVDYYTKLDELKKQQADATKITALQNTRNATIKAALAPDQVGKFDALIKNEKE